MVLGNLKLKLKALRVRRILDTQRKKVLVFRKLVGWKKIRFRDFFYRIA